MAVSIEAARLGRLLDVVVAASQGDFDVRLPLEEHDDPLLEIEVGINYMLEELAAQRDRNAAQHEELRTNARVLAEQQDQLVAALSTPVIEVWPGVLALPLIGHITDARAATITATLLARVAEARATHVILDLTGVGAVEPGTMPGLLRMSRAIELLGATCLWTGVGPELARQVIAIDAGATPMRSYGRLADALAAVLAAKEPGRRAR